MGRLKNPSGIDRCGCFALIFRAVEIHFLVRSIEVVDHDVEVESIQSVNVSTVNVGFQIEESTDAAQDVLI